MSGDDLPTPIDGGGDEATGGNEPTVPLPKITVDGRRSQIGRQIAVFAAVAAVALLAVVTAVAGTSGGDDDDDGAAELAEACSAHVVPLTEAIEGWDGIDEWAEAGGDPDLGSLSVLAIEDLATVDATSDLSVTAVALRRELDAGTSDPGAKARALRTALDETLDSLEAAAAPDGCQVNRFESAITRG